MFLCARKMSCLAGRAVTAVGARTRWVTVPERTSRELQGEVQQGWDAQNSEVRLLNAKVSCKRSLLQAMVLRLLPNMPQSGPDDFIGDRHDLFLPETHQHYAASTASTLRLVWKGDRKI